MKRDKKKYIAPKVTSVPLKTECLLLAKSEDIERKPDETIDEMDEVL